MELTGFRADRAIAIRALDALRRLDFEANRSAVATAAINHSLPFRRATYRQPKTRTSQAPTPRLSTRWRFSRSSTLMIQLNRQGLSPGPLISPVTSPATWHTASSVTNGILPIIWRRGICFSLRLVIVSRTMAIGFFRQSHNLSCCRFGAMIAETSPVVDRPLWKWDAQVPQKPCD